MVNKDGNFLELSKVDFLYKTKLLDSFYHMSQIFISSGEFKTAISNFLSLIAKILKLDRIDIFQRIKNKWSLYFSWPVIFDHDQKAQYIEESFKIINLDDNDLDLIIRQKFSIQQSQYSSSLLQPIFLGDEFWGVSSFISLNKEKEWSYDELYTSSAAINIFSFALYFYNLENRFSNLKSLEDITQNIAEISHDFNNLLTVIIGSIERISFLIKNIDKIDQKVLKSLDIVYISAIKASELVKLLLLHANPHISSHSIIDLNEFLDEIKPILKAILSQKIRISFEKEKDIWPVKIDKVQLERILINLTTNARDVMPEGGHFLLKTYNTSLSPPKARDLNIPTGKYVVLKVSDTGTGISNSIKEKIFQPYFSTRRREGGFGLGLTMALQFIKKLGGTIEIEGTSKKGTTFNLYFPAHAG